jgi:hypothetical protein
MIPQEWIPAISSSTIVAAIGGLFAIYFKARVEKNLKRDLDTHVEAFKSELRREEDTIKSDIASNEAELAAIRSTVLSELSTRRSIIEKRKIEAAEHMWAATNEFNKLLSLAHFAESINMKVALARSATPGEDQEKLKQFASMVLETSNLSDNFVPSIDVQSDRLFVSPAAWSVLSLYKGILYRPYVQFKAMHFGVVDVLKDVDPETIASLKLLLPHMSTFIDEYRDMAPIYLIDQVREKVFEELKRVIEGDAFDAKNLVDTKKIAAAVRFTEQELTVEIPDIEGLRVQS